MTEYILETDSNLNWKHEPPATSTEVHAIPSVACHIYSRTVLLLCVFWCICSLSSIRLQHPAGWPWLPLHSCKCSWRCSIFLIKSFKSYRDWYYKCRESQKVLLVSHNLCVVSIVAFGNEMKSLPDIVVLDAKRPFERFCWEPLVLMFSLYTFQEEEIWLPYLIYSLLLIK